MPTNNQHILNEAKDYLYITLGLLLYTIGWTVFLLPYEIVTGGVTGISAIIFYATNANGNGLPINYSYFTINAILLVLALKILGWKFLVKTIYAIFALSLMLGVAQDVMTNDDGTMIHILGDDEKLHALELLMDHYHLGMNAYFNPAAMPRTLVYSLEVEEMTGKRKMPK